MHRTETFEFSIDPALEAKVRDVADEDEAHAVVHEPAQQAFRIERGSTAHRWALCSLPCSSRRMALASWTPRRLRSRGVRASRARIDVRSTPSLVVGRISNVMPQAASQRSTVVVRGDIPPRSIRETDAWGMPAWAASARWLRPARSRARARRTAVGDMMRLWQH